MSKALMVAVAVAISCVACWPGRSGGAKGGAVPRPDSVRVAVLNENYFAARIHAVFDGGPRRSLGTIDGNGGRASIALAWEPRALVFELLLITDGSAYVSYPVDLAPGDSIELKIPATLRESGFFRRVRRN